MYVVKRKKKKAFMYNKEKLLKFYAESGEQKFIYGI